VTAQLQETQAQIIEAARLDHTDSTELVAIGNLESQIEMLEEELGSSQAQAKLLAGSLEAS